MLALLNVLPYRKIKENSVRKILLLLLLAALISCKRENEAGGNLSTDDTRKIYDDARQKAEAEQRGYKNDPVLRDYYEHYDRADYDAAFKSVEPVAMAGNSQAQAELASLYLNGRGVPVNINSAIVWLTRSHEQGNLMASSILGDIYYLPNLGHQDFAKAYGYYEECALQMRLACVTPFAMLHVTNGSGHYDPVKAAAWLEIGVDQNAPDAARNRDALVRQLSDDEVEQVKTAKLALLASIAEQLKRETPIK